MDVLDNHPWLVFAILASALFLLLFSYLLWPEHDEYVVQLHRTDDQGQILNSWSPITVKGKSAAERVRAELMADNTWGSHNAGWPYVTVKEVDDDRSI